MSNERSLKFKDRNAGHNGDRYWWYKLDNNTYIPPIYSFLTNDEWDIMEKWYDHTDVDGVIGECNVTNMCALHGFIMGNGVSRIVQTGTFVGYSTLLLGFMLRYMGKKHSLVTIDIHQPVSDFTENYINMAGLQEYVKVVTANSSDSNLPEKCIDYLEGNPQILIIDSSHQYQHTLDELNLWYQYIIPNGFIFMHDTSESAREYDSTKQGGVKRALGEWLEGKDVNYININSDKSEHDLVYLDGCGLGIIQKK